MKHEQNMYNIMQIIFFHNLNIQIKIMFIPLLSHLISRFVIKKMTFLNAFFTFFLNFLLFLK